jgi:hypothetical protein
MKTIVGLLGRTLPVLFAGLFAASSALAQDEQAAPPDQAPPPPQGQNAPAPPSAPPAPPDAAQAQAQTEGQWVYTDRYGWIWVPAGSEATTVNAQPYAYLYAPAYGWTWFVSPWGFGPYRAGPWIHAVNAGPWPGAPYRYYTGPSVWYGYHGVVTHPYRPSFGSHWGGGVRGGGYRR